MKSPDSIQKSTMRNSDVKASYTGARQNVKKHFIYDIPKKVCIDGDSSIFTKYVKAAYQHIHPRLTLELGEIIPVEIGRDSATHYLFPLPPIGHHISHHYTMEHESCRITYIKFVGHKKPRGSTIEW